MDDRGEPDPYRDKIRARLREAPGLAILDQFMRLESPPRFEGGVFDIDVLHILESGELWPPPGTRGTCSTPEEFCVAIAEAPPNRIGSFALVDDISPEVIETLGTEFNLRPEFFALHLRGTQCYRSKGRFDSPTYPELEVSPSFLQRAPFYCLEICRPYPFPDGSRGVEEARRSRTNTPRGCLLMKGLENLSMRERVSVYRAETSDGKQIGIVLTDHLLKKEIPTTGIDTLTILRDEYLQDGFRGPDRRNQVSCREEVTWYIQTLKPSERKSLFNPKILIIRPLLHVIIATNSWFVSEYRFNLTRINGLQHDDMFPNSCLDSVARYLHLSLYYHLKHLKNNLRVVGAKGGIGGEDGMLSDIRNLEDDMETLFGRGEHEAKLLGSRQTMEQTRASVLQARQVNLLAKIGTIFVPLNIAAAVLAIPGPWYRLVIWVGFAVVSISAICFFMLWTRREGPGEGLVQSGVFWNQVKQLCSAVYRVVYGTKCAPTFTTLTHGGLTTVRSDEDGVVLVTRGQYTPPRTTSQSTQGLTLQPTQTKTQQSTRSTFKVRISVGILVPLAVIVTAVVSFYLWRRRLQKPGQSEPSHGVSYGDAGGRSDMVSSEKPELEAGHRVATGGMGGSGSDRGEMEPQVTELASVLSTTETATELAGQQLDESVDGHGQNRATPTGPAAQHELENNEQRQITELDATNHSNLPQGGFRDSCALVEAPSDGGNTSSIPSQQPPPSAPQQWVEPSDKNGQHLLDGRLEFLTHTLPESSARAAASRVNQDANSAQLEKLRAEEARLEAHISRIQDLVRLDQERQKVREEIRRLEAENNPQQQY
ncbi:hypothetical protein FGG08_004531 [Glutinoglossum americanum]|uniref:Uncharacterized protein n=1 Tax=Glutinoglossum americanum TaxID=1670608 RepID=A0A9P8KWY3_9PEZI|nr:hypothetical protein FGG08_004531 [Glutinoglossum americanum]